MEKYNKLVAAAVGVTLLLMKDNIGLDLFVAEQNITEWVLYVLTLAGVYQVKNKE